MISRAANRTSSERSSSTSLRPAISALSFSRVRSDAGILSIGVLLCGGRSPNRTSLVRLIRRRCTPTLFPASLGLHREVIFISTTSVYRPDTRYGSSKVLAELIAEDYRKHRL